MYSKKLFFQIVKNRVGQERATETLLGLIKNPSTDNPSQIHLTSPNAFNITTNSKLPTLHSSSHSFTHTCRCCSRVYPVRVQVQVRVPDIPSPSQRPSPLPVESTSKSESLTSESESRVLMSYLTAQFYVCGNALF